METKADGVKVLRATHKGTLAIGGIEAPCHVLEDRRRVVTQRGFLDLVGMTKGSAGGDGDRLTSFTRGKRLNPFVTKDLTLGINEIIRFTVAAGSPVAYGYEATTLVDFCRAVLAAYEAGVLQGQQVPIARRCLTLVLAFSKVGIVALIDEATGFQEVRESDELRAIAEFFTTKHPTDWQKRFDDDFYRPLCAMHGLPFVPKKGGQPYKRLAQVTNELIYDRLAPGVRELIRSRNPRGRSGRREYKHHQFLSRDIGIVSFNRVMTKVVEYLTVFTDYKSLLAKMDEQCPRYGREALAGFIGDRFRVDYERMPLFRNLGDSPN